MNGSTRDVDFDAPLGEHGVGVDSLGLVQFMLALETAYQLRVPVEFWARADQVSLRKCVEIVLTATGRCDE